MTFRFLSIYIISGRGKKAINYGGDSDGGSDSDF